MRAAFTSLTILVILLVTGGAQGEPVSRARAAACDNVDYVIERFNQITVTLNLFETKKWTADRTIGELNTAWSDLQGSNYNALRKALEAAASQRDREFLQELQDKLDERIKFCRTATNQYVGGLSTEGQGLNYYVNSCSRALQAIKDNYCAPVKSGSTQPPRAYLINLTEVPSDFSVIRSRLVCFATGMNVPFYETWRRPELGFLPIHEGLIRLGACDSLSVETSEGQAVRVCKNVGRELGHTRYLAAEVAKLLMPGNGAGRVRAPKSSECSSFLLSSVGRDYAFRDCGSCSYRNCESLGTWTDKSCESAKEPLDAQLAKFRRALEGYQLREDVDYRILELR